MIPQIDLRGLVFFAFVGLGASSLAIIALIGWLFMNVSVGWT